jgi:hypothetical protein
VRENNIAVRPFDPYVAAIDIRVRGNFGCGEVGTGLGDRGSRHITDTASGPFEKSAPGVGFRAWVRTLGERSRSMLFIKGGS